MSGLSTEPPIPAGVIPVPDHELLRLIGRGSYGEVWLARNALGTLRAIKIVRRHSFDSARPYEREFAGIQRFEPVARSHEGLVDILHVGRNDLVGCFYYVMELADACAPEVEASSPYAPAGWPTRTEEYAPRTLSSDIARSKRLPASECLPVFLTLTSALAHLHKQGLLHRDIKPSNIVFVGGVAKLADIGLVVEARNAATWVGTEGFIPPEGPGTKQADLYALGKVLYEAATGRDRMDYPALPVGRGKDSANADLLELNAIFLKACARDPSQRYQSAEEMHTDLALLQSGRSVKRHYALETSLAHARQVGMVAALLAAFAVGAVWFKSREAEVERRHRQEVELALSDANVARARAERNSGTVGARQASLEALAAAVKLRGPTAEARSEAITALALTDVRELSETPVRDPKHWSCVSDDFRWLAESDAQGSLHLSPLVEGRRGNTTRTIPGDGRLLQVVGPFSPDNSKILVVTLGGEEKVWDTRNGDLLLRSPPTRWRRRLFTHDSRQLAVLEEDGFVRFHDLRAGGAMRPALLAPVDSFALSTDGQWFAGGEARTNRVRIYRFPAMDPVAELNLSEGVLGSPMEFRPDSSAVALVCSDLILRIWNWRAPSAPLVEFHGHNSMPFQCVLIPPGDLMVSSAWDGTTRLWDTVRGTQIATIPHTGFQLIAESSGQRWGRHTTPGYTFRFFSARRSDVCRVFYEPSRLAMLSPQHASFSPDGRILLTAGQGGVRLLSSVDGRELAQLPGETAIRAVFDGAGRSVWVSGKEQVTRWPVQRMSPDRWRVGPPVLVEALPDTWNSVSATNRPWVVLGSLAQGRIRVYEQDSVVLKLTNSDACWHASISHDGQWVAATRRFSAVRVWRADSGELQQLIRDPKMVANALSPEGRWVFTASSDGLRQWEVSNARQGWSNTNLAITGNTPGLACSPDGHLLVALINERQIALVDASTGGLIARLDHPNPQLIVAIAFSQDGGQLAVACPSGMVQVWDLRRLRAELGALNLDWNHPPLPADPAPSSVPPHIEVVTE